MASNTGSYRYIDGQWRKVSDKPPRLVDAYVPEGGYVDEHLGRFVEGPNGYGGRWEPAQITSREQKASLMREKGIVEDGGFTKPTKRLYFDQGK